MAKSHLYSRDLFFFHPELYFKFTLSCDVYHLKQWILTVFAGTIFFRNRLGFYHINKNKNKNSILSHTNNIYNIKVQFILHSIIQRKFCLQLLLQLI